MLDTKKKDCCKGIYENYFGKWTDNAIASICPNNDTTIYCCKLADGVYIMKSTMSFVFMTCYKLSILFILRLTRLTFMIIIRIFDASFSVFGIARYTSHSTKYSSGIVLFFLRFPV